MRRRRLLAILAVALAAAASLSAAALAQPIPSGVVVENITYGSGETELPGILARPEKIEGKAPAVLALHGGGNSGLQRAMKWLVEGLAARGYVALSGTYRPSSRPADDLADVRMAIDHLVSLPYVDATRIGMTGQSRGAGNSFRAALYEPRVKAIVPISGGASMPDAPRPDAMTLSEQRFMEQIRGAGGFPEELATSERPRDPTAQPRVNPLEVKVPVLMIQGTWDLHAAAEGAILLKETARKAGLSHIKVNVIPGMGHFFDTPRGVVFTEMIALVGDWFDETLRGRKTGRDFEKPIELAASASFPSSDRYSVRPTSYRREGQEVSAFLLEPRGGSRRRAVLYAPDGHSGAEASRLGFLIKALGEAGHTVLVTCYSDERADLTDDADISAGLDHLATLPGVDASSLAVVGHGRGGMAALRTTAKDKRVKMVVALGAPANLTRLIKGLRAYSAAAAEFQASRLAGPDKYRALSPQYYARDIKVPVLLVHGTLDLMVAPEHMLWNAVALMTTGNIEVELYMPPWDIHHFDSTFAYLRPEEWVGRITAFLERGVLYQPSGHSKASQSSIP